MIALNASCFDTLKDFDVDLLPGFVEERIEKGFSPVSRNFECSHASIRPSSHRYYCDTISYQIVPKDPD